VDRIYRHLRHTNSGTILEKPIGHSVRPETTSFAHTQSALDPAQKDRFRGLRYGQYDPALRLVLPLEPAQPDVVRFGLSEDDLVLAERFAQMRFRLQGRECVLSVDWLLGYGGGVFLPFRDATSGHTNLRWRALPARHDQVRQSRVPGKRCRC
jgi:uncharacterized protein (DUF1684 family)